LSLNVILTVLDPLASCRIFRIRSSLVRSSMATARSSYNTETRGSPSPIGESRLPGKASSVHVPDETSPLLPVQSEPVVLKSQQSLSERWHSTVSTSLDENVGLLFIVAAQFLFTASSVAVKWLNGSDEHIPMLEVRDAPRTINTSTLG
jgi:hypothetical protein